MDDVRADDPSDLTIIAWLVALVEIDVILGALLVHLVEAIL